MKFLLVALLLLVMIATPALGKNDNSSSGNQGQGNSQNNSQGNQGNQGNSQGNSDSNPGSEKKEEQAAKKEDRAQASSSPSAKKLNSASTRSATDSAQQCDHNYPWKNHGEYVSCVAKSGAGGQAVSEAARSDIGKKSGTPSASLSPSPDASGSATPSASVSPSPEATSSGLINSITENLATVQEGILTIGDQFAALLDLLNPFD